MKDTVKVLDIQLDTLSAKETMRRAMGYMETEPLSTMEIVTMDTLLLVKENPKLQEDIESIDMVLPGNQEILSAAEITDKKYVQEVSTQLFMQMFAKYLHKNYRKVFLLGETEQEVEELFEYLKEYYYGIVVVGREVLSDEAATAEMIANKINGTETECILSIVSSPRQEAFIAENRPLLNARLWLGCGKGIPMKYKKNTRWKLIQDFFIKRVFRHQVELEKRK